MIATIGITLLLFLGIVYLLPTIIAVARSHPAGPLIFMVNIAFGWTLLVWIICIIWAFSNDLARARRSA